jgi:uncharacterized membrane protein YhaH (DUF805 family)
MDYFIEAIKKYAVFSGRARRKEYWIFTLWATGISIVLALYGDLTQNSTLSLVLIYGYVAFMFIPSIAVSVRRLHDIGRSGWWIFINVVPFIGIIILLIFACTDSQPGDNQYGANPKGVGAAPTATPTTTS